jgi:two-component system chemotaxis response regulator CheB
MRELICDALAAHADLEIVGTAADGDEALKALGTLQPDILTLDLQMPRMDGLTALDRILATRPTPVIVVSALTQRAADTTMQALQRGAMDYVAKPEGLKEARRVFAEELPTKLRNMAGTDVARVLRYRQARERRASSIATTKTDAASAAQFAGSCIALGISTGGPPALTSLFSALLPPLPPIVIVQHMPPMFTGPFALRLNSLSCLTVKEAREGDVLEPNTALVAPGGKHLALKRRGGQVVATLSDGEMVSGHKPSADVMMRSAAEIYGRRCLGVIMTGMGRDGSDGCQAIRAQGGYVLGQDEATSDVYGMNKVAFVEGHVDLQVGLDRMPDAISLHGRKLIGLRGLAAVPAR